jgi:BirA family transcriptional regulator, biotin operon repressor / biotin---[acetyl-CoA-carboxylase] ligase
MKLSIRVLQTLAAARASESGARQFISGASLASQYSVTRSAIWKAVSQLRKLGTDIEAVTRQGYRLALPASPLVTSAVIDLLSPATRPLLRVGECAGSIISTNTQLLERGAPPVGRFDFLTAEHQTAGRGRRGRNWLAPPGSAVCLSWSWCFAGMSNQMGALSLAIGVAALRALRSLDIKGTQLKWPNDLVTADGKLGGILIEMRTESAGPVHVVTGMGLNLALSSELRQQIRASGNTPTDLCTLAGAIVSRSALVAALLNHGIAAMEQFGREGFAPFLAEYSVADCLRDRAVTINGGPVDAGTARGVDADGALRVEQAGTTHRIIAGEVSVRTEQT